jgi:hypothetical protein
MIAGYTTSKDYTRLAELMKTREIVCIIDGVYTSVAYARKDSHGSDVFLASAAGNLFIHTDSPEDFASSCKNYSLEWIVPDDLREPVKTVDEVINEVARDLPAGWQVVITEENGWAGVSAINPNGVVWDMANGIHTISEQIRNAVELAKHEESKNKENEV